MLDCLALPSGVEREGYPSPPPGLPVGTVYVLEVSREAERGPSVGVALHYGEDADWKALMQRDHVRVDHPFVYECWADDDGAPDEFLRTVESSSFFQLAGSKSSLLTTVFDSDHECPLRFERDG